MNFRVATKKGSRSELVFSPNRRTDGSDPVVPQNGSYARKLAKILPSSNGTNDDADVDADGNVDEISCENSINDQAGKDQDSSSSPSEQVGTSQSRWSQLLGRLERRRKVLSSGSNSTREQSMSPRSSSPLSRVSNSSPSAIDFSNGFSHAASIPSTNVVPSPTSKNVFESYRDMMRSFRAATASTS